MTNNDRIVKDLLNDEYFYKWLIDPDKACMDFWANWGDEAAERQETMVQARTILLSYNFKFSAISQAKKNMIWDHITDQIAKTSSIKKEQQKNSTRHLWYATAAAVTLLMMVFFTYNRFWDGGHTQITESEKSFIEKVAPEGNISTFRFEDGTAVKLFAGSVIRYPLHFSEQHREVYLEGEGFFEVTRDATRPFKVKTNSLITTAIGTSFNIRTYENGSKCEVSLVTGKVRVEMLENSNEIGKQVLLEPGEQAVMKFEGVVKQSFHIEETVSWKDGYIYLEDKSFDETISILKRWFKVDFEVNNGKNVNGKTGMGKFKNQSLENILRVIGHSFDFEYKIEDEKVILTF